MAGKYDTEIEAVARRHCKSTGRDPDVPVPYSPPSHAALSEAAADYLAAKNGGRSSG